MNLCQAAGAGHFACPRAASPVNTLMTLTAGSHVLNSFPSSDRQFA